MYNNQQTTTNKQQPTNNNQQTTTNKQQTTNNKQQTTNNKKSGVEKHRWWDTKSLSIHIFRVEEDIQFEFAKFFTGVVQASRYNNH